MNFEQNARDLKVALILCGLSSLVMAICQHGYFNADFVAYASVAHRCLEQPAKSITGAWAPLFSWAMAPLIAFGINDLVAGRIVLWVTSLGYVMAVYSLCNRWLPESGRAMRSAVLVAAVLQSVLFSGWLLDPDLLGCALLFACLAGMSAPTLFQSSLRPLCCGAVGGLAYLGKAYMLPVLLLLVPLLVWHQHRRIRAQLWPMCRTLACFLLGFILVGGPWIAVLSEHYGRLLFSTAGPNNHANFGPQAILIDAMWNPPLGLHYILDPHYEPDWSPFASIDLFIYQMKLSGRNLLRMLGHLAGWLLLIVVACLRRRARVASGDAARLDPEERSVAWLSIVMAALYSLGYLMIDTERRYVMPAMAPLLAIAGFVIWPWPHLVGGAKSSSATALGGALLALLFGLQEVRLVYKAASAHGQMGSTRPLESMAAAIRAARLAEIPFAASNWHGGLGFAFIGKLQDYYFGCPRGKTPTERDQELRAAGVRCYLRFGDTAKDDVPMLPPSWKEFPLSLPVETGRLRVYLRDT